MLRDKPFVARIVSTFKRTQNIVERAQKLVESVKSAKQEPVFRFAKRARCFVRGRV